MRHIKRYRHEVEFLVLVIVVFLLWYLGRYFHIDTQAIQRSLQRLPLFYSGIIYIALYVIVTFFVFFSKDVFWLMGAVLFGPLLSALLISLSEIINAFILFYLARSLGRSFVSKRLSAKYKELDEKLGRINFFWLFIFRVAPLIPYRFQDLTAGLTRIHFRRYITAVILGSPLKIFWIQYILFGVGINTFNPSALAGYFLGNKALFIFSIIYIILVIAVIVKLRSQD